ncbi:MAG: metallophosphoesterase family protein [Thermoguttaceae bacterium]
MGPLGILSDTHNANGSIVEALEMFRKSGVEQIVHCGDVTSPEAVRHFRGYKVTFVFGNNDLIFKDNEKSLREAVTELGNECSIGHQPVSLEWNKKKICLIHGHDGGFKLARKAFDSGDWDYVIFGHSHIVHCPPPVEGVRTTLLNPGSVQDSSYYILFEDGELVRYLYDEECDTPYEGKEPFDFCKNMNPSLFN